MNNFKKNVNNLQIALENAKSSNIDFSTKDNASLTDYKALKGDYLKKEVERNLIAVKKASIELHDLSKFDSNNSESVAKIQDLVKDLKLDDVAELEKSIIAIKELLDKLHYPKGEQKLSIKANYIPNEIKADVFADIKELEKCFHAGCYRSATIICGRILETALHRKYYEVTGIDILEKNPGIGLGKLIAKLSEKNVQFDPGLTQQIHLINQVRIFSVHTKKEAFYPSEAQTHAMVLYTMDVLEKLFTK